MAEHVQREPKPEVFNQNDTGSWMLFLMVGAAAGIVVSAIYAIVPSCRPQFAFSWLFFVRRAALRTDWPLIPK